MWIRGSIASPWWEPMQVKWPRGAIYRILKRERPSVSHNEVKQRLEQNANVTVSIPTISRAVNHRLSDGGWTFKKLVRTAKERFTMPNLRYTQAYVDVLHQRNPYKLIFFDEAGFKLPDVGNPTHGHAPSGERAVEVQSRGQTRNMTLNLAVGLCGLYADVVCGASNTQNYLEFLEDAATYGENFDGTAFLSAGNTVVVDNCAIAYIFIRFNIFTLANNFLRWTYIGPTRFIHSWTT